MSFVWMSVMVIIDQDPAISKESMVMDNHGMVYIGLLQIEKLKISASGVVTGQQESEE